LRRAEHVYVHGNRDAMSSACALRNINFTNCYQTDKTQRFCSLARFRFKSLIADKGR
jgi:hypothetical protein